MSASGKKLLSIGATVAIASTTLLWLTWKSFPDACGNEIIDQIASPDAKWNAIVFDRECGATTGISIQVALLRKGRRLSNSDAGNVLTFTDRQPGTVYARAEWTAQDELTLEYPSTARVAWRKDTYEGVRVKYVLK